MLFFVKYINIFLFIVLLSALNAKELSFEYRGIPVTHTFSDGSKKTFVIKREIPSLCKKIPITNEMLWTGNYANPKVPQNCVSSYLHTPGKLLPITIDEDVQTVGELEVLSFIKQMQQDKKKKLLIDARKESWYDYRTIPGAINIPFNYIKNHQAHDFKYEAFLKQMGVEIDRHTRFDFRDAKDILVFCNGPWCSQSIAFIEALVEAGYDPEKIKWYRGGLQAWLQAGMTSTRPATIAETSPKSTK